MSDIRVYSVLSVVSLDDFDSNGNWLFGADNEVYAFRDGELSLEYYHDQFEAEVRLVDYRGQLLAANTLERDGMARDIELHPLAEGDVPAEAVAVRRYLYFRAQCGESYLGNILDEKGQWETLLARFDPETGDEEQFPTEEYDVVCADGALYARGLETVSKYDSDLNRIWRFTYAKDACGVGIGVPWPFGDTVIVSLGVDPNRNRRENGEIVALAKEDGRVVWSQVLEGLVDNCLVIGDKVCVAHGREMVVLDAATGKRLVRADSGLECDNYSSTLWTDGRYLYFFSEYANRFRLFTLDGQTLVQEVAMPKEFRIGRMDYATRCPLLRGGRVYVPVYAGESGLNTALYGLLEMTPGEGDMYPEVEVEQGPPVAVEKLKEGKAEYYTLTLSHDRLDDVIRFGELAVKRVAGLHGWQIWNSPVRNRKFDGRIVLRVDGAKLDQAKAATLLDTMVKRVHGWAETMTVRAGTRKDPIAFRWEWL